MRIAAALTASLLVLILASCGGSDTSSETGAAPPRKAQIASCLQAGHATLARSSRSNEVAAFATDKSIIVALVFSDGSEGETAAGELETETDAEGDQRQVEVIDGGQVVLSLSREPTEEDFALAKRCAG